jgi:hypothetical protein
MMKKIILLIIIQIALVNIYSKAQDILWKKNFGLNSADDYGRSAIETDDGGIAIAGYTGSYGAGGFDVWLIKTDADGNILWTKTYGGLGDDYAYSLKQTDDGGFLIGGATNSFGVGGLDYYLIKTDSLGDTLWTKTFGGVNDDICWSIAVVDYSYILVGEKNAIPFHPDIWIIKTDLSGTQLWTKTYGNTGDDVAYFISKAGDDNYIIAGKTGYPTPRAWLLKINSVGDTIWTKTYGESYDSFHSYKELTNHNLIITGMRYIGGEGWNVCLLKTDSLGNTDWEKTYDYQNDYDIGYSVQQTSDGGFIVCGSSSVDGGALFGWIIRTNEMGDTLWTQEVHSYVKSNILSSINTTLYSVIQSSNGDYVVVGNQPILPVSDHAQQVVLLRIASDIVPVELTSFTATVERNAVSLNWQTATETNNSGFEIERKQIGSPKSSVGNQDWNQIAFVPGFGTTTEPKSYSLIDEYLSSGKYQYRLKQIDFDGTFEYSNTVEVEITSPTEFSLEQNYPNPFNPTTKIKYTIPSVTLNVPVAMPSKGDILVSLKVFDVLGNEVATLVSQPQQPGTYEVEFNADKLSSGVYYYQLRYSSFVETKKMILLR